MRIAITGGKGMLGRTLRRRLAGHELMVEDLPEVDILDLKGLTAAFNEFSPDVVVHCAAMTKVDDCETKDELAFRLNGTGSANVAYACSKCGARLMEKISTKSKRKFFGCERYPECDFVSWERPVPQKCEKCGSYMVLKIGSHLLLFFSEGWLGIGITACRTVYVVALEDDSFVLDVVHHNMLDKHLLGFAATTHATFEAQTCIGAAEAAVAHHNAAHALNSLAA